MIKELVIGVLLGRRAAGVPIDPPTQAAEVGMTVDNSMQRGEYKGY
jgi:hypothetical protein